ncbi:hypothetical protein FGO68_gene11119 [Halteria grandinella]|uniref:Secreted protein n=1 Tax=Halteria grandinella TaxID=5974 RepID=A0A8J8NHJ4_HALGN|nr:hypothetical protein FGO68_gene11119 [Halteria grandinella]
MGVMKVMYTLSCLSLSLSLSHSTNIKKSAIAQGARNVAKKITRQIILVHKPVKPVNSSRSMYTNSYTKYIPTKPYLGSMLKSVDVFTICEIRGRQAGIVIFQSIITHP